jgi:hypothetical protein
MLLSAEDIATRRESQHEANNRIKTTEHKLQCIPDNPDIA